MSADRFEDLLTWQLMYELSLGIWKFTDQPPASRNFKHRDQIRDSSDSAHRNVAEGFGRYNPGEFARFLDVSRGSAEETRALLKTAHGARYLSDEEFAALDALAIRGLQALAKLQRYLRSPAAKRNAERWRYRKQRARYNRNASNGSNGSNGSNDSNVSNVSNGSNVPNDPNDPNDPNV
jgi:four helix bundle protein